MKYRNVLEYGCGNGRMTEFIAQDYKVVYAVDISAEMIVGACASFPQYTFLVHDMEKPWPLPLEDKYMIVLSLYAPFNYSLNPRSTLEEVHQCLHPNGTGLFHIVGPRFDFRYGEVRDEGSVPYIRYTTQSLSDLFRLYFGFVEITPFGLIVDYLPSWLSP